jgi:hypothetical protein
MSRFALRSSPSLLTLALLTGVRSPSAQNIKRIFELDRSDKTVWEYKGVNSIFRARRR